MLRVLIAEDDVMIADMIQEIVVDGGYEVCGVARTVAGALELGNRRQPDLAILNYRLANGGLGTDAAVPLMRRSPRLGVLYLTGNLPLVVANATVGHACLSKPVRSAGLLQALQIVREILSTGTAEPPFPSGLRMLKPPLHALSEIPHGR